MVRLLTLSSSMSDTSDSEVIAPPRTGVEPGSEVHTGCQPLERMVRVALERLWKANLHWYYALLTV